MVGGGGGGAVGRLEWGGRKVGEKGGGGERDGLGGRKMRGGV